MHSSHDKPGLVGPLLWVSSIQYFIVQLIVIAAWTVPHSWADNFISDLGNTECGIYSGLAVCSPLHLLMNISFVVFGITMTVGSLYLSRQFKRTKLSLFAFGLMMLSGVGTMLVGLFPENTINAVHMFGALLGLGVGNVSVLLFGFALKDINPAVRAYTIMSGIFSLVAFSLFVSEMYFGFGRGGMERLISYPFALWMVVFGCYMVIIRAQSRRSHSIPDTIETT